MPEKPDTEEMEQKIKALENALEESQRRCAALTQSEAKFRILAELSPAAIMFYQDGQWIYANQATETIFGYSAKELLGLDFLDIVHHDDKPLIRECIQKLHLGEAMTYRHAVKIVRKDGSEKWVGMAGASTMIEGKSVGVISMADITDRKQTEAALQESEAKFREIFETIEDLYYEAESSGIITMLSPSVHRLTDWQAEDLIGKPVTSVYANPDDRVRLVSKLLEKGYVSDYEILLKMKSGDAQHVSLSARLIHDKQGKPIGIRGLLRNITERKRAEEEREKLIAELQEALSKVKTLSGLLPICASCKKIRDDKGYWNQIESYIKDHSEAEFSHGICPDCMRKLYPETYKKKQTDQK